MPDTAVTVPASESTHQKRYFNAIDGLRLLAAVNVVWFHLEAMGGFNDLGGKPGWLFRIIKGPAFHASLFFILGGFIFATKFATKAAEFDSRAFLKKRLRELYPLHLITTLTMAALYVIKRWGTDEVINVPKLIFSSFMHLSFLWSFCPIGSLNLNTPSWALSAMFLCYVLLGPLLKWSITLQSRLAVMGWMAVFFIPLTVWGLLYGAIGQPNIYQLFHGFAPVRFFEFGLGALLARFFALRNEHKRTPLFIAARCDIVVLLLCGAVFFNLSSTVRSTKTAEWLSYHVLMIPLYLTAIYTMSIERGLFARIMAQNVVRKLGRTSFYPYLIHIPLMSVITLFCERMLNYKKFLHHPINIIIFTILLYGLSYIYVYAIRNKRREKNVLIKSKSLNL
ncbi:MAG: acyltransferase [Chitinispirillales bacterium]|jgi:peptidoglycan/LPS O-acetylase OafA/YrhL|nr:acyltransferase [Chitinispirillales bacterium]